MANKKQRVLLQQQINSQSSSSMQTSSTSDWSKLCVICALDRNRKQSNPRVLTSGSSARAKGIRAHALLLGDDKVRRNLDEAKTFAGIPGKYHMKCYQVYLQKNPKHSASSLRNFRENAAKNLLDSLKSRLEGGEIFSLSEVTKLFKEKMDELTENYDVTPKSCNVKKWMSNVGEGVITFHPLGPGKTDIMCKHGLSLSSILSFCTARNQEEADCNFSFPNRDLPSDPSETDVACLFRAALILKNAINDIPSTKVYPAPEDCLLESSVAFVPNLVLSFFKRIVKQGPTDREDDCSESEIKRAVTLAESLIYSSRRVPGNQVIPPFHIGIAAQIMHEDGSRTRVENLHSHGLSISYDELRKFQTSAGEEELKGNDDVYLPKSIAPVDEGGLLVQEGDDNIDIDVETIDGKNTCHFMGRVVFQMQRRDQKKPFVPLERRQRRSLDVNKQDMPQFKVPLFKKPPKKPEPYVFPGGFQDLKAAAERVRLFLPKDVMWVLLRGVSRGNILFYEKIPEIQIVPFWTGFNTRLGSIEDRVTVTSYLPSIDKQPSDPSTVLKTLRDGQEMARKCGQSVHVHTFDQQLYAKALLVKLSLPEEFPPSVTVLRLGGFHFLSIFIGCIGKLWGDAGLRDMLVDSNIYAGITADQMLKGKQFYRAVRGLTICFEVLVTLLLENFQGWLLEESPETIDDMLVKVEAAHKAYQEGDSTGEAIQDLQSFISESFLPHLEKFVDIGKSTLPTFSFWYDCIFSLHLMLVFYRADRESVWDTHVSSCAAMLPLFFACDKPNYARYGTYYVLDMIQNLPPCVQTAFADGQHSIKLSTGVFKGLFSDIAVEMTVVRDTKSSRSGIVGYSRKEKALLLWGLVRHTLAKYSRSMRERSGQGDDDFEDTDLHHHEQESASFLSRDDRDVQQVLDFMKTTMIDPFSASGLPNGLSHIGNGPIAPRHIENSLVGALSTGRNLLESFVKERLEKDAENRKLNFHDPISHSGVKTFSDLKKPTPIRVNGELITKCVSPEVVLQRAMEVKKYRGEALSLPEVLSRPLTSVPSSLFKPDGTMRHTNKADLTAVFEEELRKRPVEVASPLSLDSVCTVRPETPGNKIILIIDAMADLQKLNPKGTFDVVGEIFVKKIQSKLCYCDEVHVVFDRYDDKICPKDLERQRRYALGGHPYEIGAGKQIPSWERIISSNENKGALAKFLCHYIVSRMSLAIPEGKCVVLGGGFETREQTKLVKLGHSEQVVSLTCNHSEADTRMIFHVIEASTSSTQDCTVFVESPDADVLVLLTAHYHRCKTGSKVWFETGCATKETNRHRFIPVHTLAFLLETQYPFILLVLLVIHVLTGCDTVSSLYSIGKKSAFLAAKRMTKEERYALGMFGDGSQESWCAAVKFIASLYDTKGKFKEIHHDINLLRAKLSLQKSNADRLPPSQAALEQHLLRGQWQLYYWKLAYFGVVPRIDPLVSGWTLEQEKLQPLYFWGPTSLELIQGFFCSCKSKNSCTSNPCPCKVQGMPCCEELCSCSTCMNKPEGS